MSAFTPTVTGSGPRAAVQRFGAFLAGMIMPNLGAFIAWGLITAVTIQNGWVNLIARGVGAIGPEDVVPFVAQISTVVGPIIVFLLPILIGYTGGRQVHGQRGAVVGAIATMGAVVAPLALGYIGSLQVSQAAGTAISGTATVAPTIGNLGPNFLAGLIMGPLAAVVLKGWDRLVDGKLRAGFEMLVDNFSAGILGFVLALAAFFGLAPLVKLVSDGLGHAVNFLVTTGLLPIASIIVEPAKVLFLNNAINHGVLTPLGVEAADKSGSSLLFLVEANPGPGAGLLIAFTLFGVGAARATAPGALLIQFVGGIHEVYFPYVLAKPQLLVAMILGGATGVATNLIAGSGLRAPAAPGSIIAVVAQGVLANRPGNIVGVLLSVLLSAAVTFVVAAFLLRLSRKRDLETADAAFGAAITQTSANKGKESSVLNNLAGVAGQGNRDAMETGTISDIVFACDAGMGSSAMGASVLRKKLKDAGVENVTVVNKAISNLEGHADLVITQRQLTDRAREKEPNARHVSVDNFMGSPAYDEVVQLVKSQNEDANTASVE